MDKKAWLRENAEANLRAAEKLIPWGYINAAANRLYYAVYHACWWLLRGSNFELVDLQSERPGNPTAHTERLFHETLNGKTMMKCPVVDGCGYAQHEVQQMILQAKAYRLDADYRGVPVDPEKLKARLVQVEKFFKRVQVLK